MVLKIRYQTWWKEGKILDIETKYFSTSDYNKVTGQIVEWVDKFVISGYGWWLGKKIAILATKSELKADQDKIVKLKVFDSSYFYSNFF